MNAPDRDDELADAADILRARGRTVEPTGDDMALWLVDGAVVFTDDELLQHAAWIGLRAGPERVQ